VAGRPGVRGADHFVECAPHDPADLLPSDGIMYLFSTCAEGDIDDGGEDAFVLRYHRGPSSELIKLPHPDDVDATEGRFVARGMAFAPSFVLAGEDELGAGRPDDRDEAILESVGGGVRGGARMLGRPTFFRPELSGAFDPEQNTLLLALSGMRLWRGADDRASIYGDGTFFVIVSPEGLRNGDVEDAWVLFESGT
jgi:hypothetical protein